jgi:hypothetical protein
MIGGFSFKNYDELAVKAAAQLTPRSLNIVFARRFCLILHIY